MHAVGDHHFGRREHGHGTLDASVVVKLAARRDLDHRGRLVHVGLVVEEPDVNPVMHGPPNPVDVVAPCCVGRLVALGHG
eukprot:scaffold144244_cov118-Phaeocystis_antarctica.AAC.1